ncbi:MAG: AlpA family phage regulatory protein [Pseudomonadales bacterium]|nr:AlpA family phage regulatory protein [Pseudomonadales bacterium]
MPHNSERIIRLPDVISMTGLCKSTIRRLELSNTFPKRINIGPRAVGWKFSAIQTWMNDPEGYGQEGTA